MFVDAIFQCKKERKCVFGEKVPQSERAVRERSILFFTSFGINGYELPSLLFIHFPTRWIVMNCESFSTARQFSGNKRNRILNSSLLDLVLQFLWRKSTFLSILRRGGGWRIFFADILRERINDRRFRTDIVRKEIIRGIGNSHSHSIVQSDVRVTVLHVRERNNQ